MDEFNCHTVVVVFDMRSPSGHAHVGEQMSTERHAL